MHELVDSDGGSGVNISGTVPKISISADESPTFDIQQQVDESFTRRHHTHRTRHGTRSGGSSVLDARSVGETNVLLDADMLSRPDIQALVVAVLVRSWGESRCNGLL